MQQAADALAHSRIALQSVACSGTAAMVDVLFPGGEHAACTKADGRDWTAM